MNREMKYVLKTISSESIPGNSARQILGENFYQKILNAKKI